MSAGIDPRKIVVHVLPTDPQVRALVERYLRDGGFALPGGAQPPTNEGATVTASRIPITDRQREVLQALASCDHTAEMAERLCITEKAVDDFIQRLKETLDVGSRHRLALKAAAFRLVTVEFDP